MPHQNSNDTSFEQRKQCVTQQYNTGGDMSVGGDAVGGDKIEHHYHTAAVERGLDIHLHHLPVPSTKRLIGRERELQQLDAAWEDERIAAASLPERLFMHWSRACTASAC